MNKFPLTMAAMKKKLDRLKLSFSLRKFFSDG